MKNTRFLGCRTVLLGSQFIIASRLCADKSTRSVRPRLIEAGEINRPGAPTFGSATLYLFTRRASEGSLYRKVERPLSRAHIFFALYTSPSRAIYFLLATGLQRAFVASARCGITTLSSFTIIVRMKREREVRRTIAPIKEAAMRAP